MQSAISVTTLQIRALEGASLSWFDGSDQALATSVGTPELLISSQLAFVSDPKFLSEAADKASLLIVEKKLLSTGLKCRSDQAIWSTPSLKAAMVLILPLFDPRRELHPLTISPRAFVHPTAKIGARTRVAPGAHIGAYAVVGDDCVIHANAVIEDFCRLGNRCTILAGAVIGSDGFGFFTDPQGRQQKIPQIGIVVLEDDVEIGACTTIDRATLGETRIGKGSKFDNNCHVAHNCHFGQDNLIAASLTMAGSTSVGNHVIMAGSVDVTDHVNICDRVLLGGRSAVGKDITIPGAYAGYPLEPLRQALKTAQNLTHLTRMRQQLSQISKKLGLQNEKGS